ncbi:NRT1 PTR FAMILY -like [Chlorella sorokiniana]|uniref:NRT1 PTR FAMILY-like n=1 Tax=Chlorella sorokiniana TaxID=3076 RepID=A0A2P6TN44_CHLSO|nr:NRT1 PTR FAMILY -like [Chlorella sorokiniana]|eukprot:PRW50755.1 NRT1 PTR FAMILY -like [Chlorella sorokiniana]
MEGQEAYDPQAALAPIEEPQRRRSTLLTVCPFILGNEFCERLAFYGLSTNLIVYLTHVMGEDNGFAAIQLNLFEGTCYLTPLLGAWLADSAWGRYKTILIFSVIYLLGMILLAFSAWAPGLTPGPDEYSTPLQNAFLYASLYIVALGTGGIKPNVSAFGADQFDEADPQDRREKTSFFNWFYFFVNIGSLLAVTIIVWVQENVGWALGFAIPALAMLCAIITFVAGSPLYTHVAPTESPISRVFKVVWAAWRAPKQAAGDGSEPLLSRGGSGGLDSSLPAGLNGSSSLHGGLNGSSAAAAAMGGTGGLGGGMGRRTQSLQWLNAAAEVRVAGGGRRFSQRQVEEVKLVLRLLPVFATTSLYWTIYMQMGSFFVAQGVKMDRTLPLPGGGTFVVPAASLAMVNTLGIVIIIPLYDKLFVPAMRRLGRPITLLQRIGWGLVVCVASMLIAAWVEHARLQRDSICYSGGGGALAGAAAGGGLGLADAAVGAGLAGLADCSSGGPKMSVWYQVPQYLAVGLSEVFTSIGQLELFYDQAPDVMRSCSMALVLLSVCIGSYLSGALVYAVTVITRRMDPLGEGWLPKDLNHGRLDLFFLLLAGLMAANLALYLWVAANYEYKAVEHVKRVTLPRAQRQRPPAPPRPPQPPPRSAPVASLAASRAHPQAVPGSGTHQIKTAMQQQLGLSALRLPSSLAELGAKPLFSAAAAAAQEGHPDAAEVAAVLQQARRQPVTALDWALLFQALTTGQLQGSQPAQLVAVLSWAADSVREQLEAAAAAGERPSGGGGGSAAAHAGCASDVGNPRLRQALQNTLKLSLLFLCSLARGEGAAGREEQHPAAASGKRGGKKAKAAAGGSGEAAAQALAQLSARRDALLAAGSIEDAIHDNRALLPSVSGMRAAGRLVRGAAMHCLVHPLPAGAAGGDRTAKDLVEACFQAASGILARTFVSAEERQAQAAAAQTLQDLLGVVAAPKQQAQVLAGAARLVASVMHQSRRAGVSIVARLADRIQQAAAAASRASKDAGAAALAAQECDACLHFAVLLAGSSGGGGGSGALQAALLLRLPQLLPLARSPSSSTRRLMLDLCSALLPSAAQLPFSPAAAAAAAVPSPAAEAAAAAPAEEPPTPPANPRQAYRAALLAAVVGRLEDKDATLRAKALSCLEKHASLVAAHMNAAGSQCSSGGSALLRALCGRLCDKSPSVRKKAVALLAALLQPAAGLSHPAAAALAGAVLPLAAQLLGVRPDSALHLGEDILKVLSQAVLRMASAGSSAAGVPHLLQLAASTTEPAARAQLQAAVLDLLLPPSAGPPSAELLLRNLAAAARQCSEQQLEQLRQAVQQVVGSSGGGVTAAVVRSAVRACYQQLHSLCSGGVAQQQAAGSSSEVAPEEGAAADGSTAAAKAEGLRSAATALFVLGPLSGSPQADASASLAEIWLLLAGLQHVAQAGISKHTSAAARLLASTTLVWKQVSEGTGEDEGAAPLPAAVQAAALRALGRLALLSEPLSQRAVALAEEALSSGSGRTGMEVQAAAVALLADAIEAFPNQYSSRLLLIGRLMVPGAEPAAAGGMEPAGGPAESSGTGSADAASELAATPQQAQQDQESSDGPAAEPTVATSRQAPAAAVLTPEQQEPLAQAAAAAYCRLLLRNKLKLQGMLGPLGSALASASPTVAALVQHALRQMLGAAAPKERARLCMALFHQTPPDCRVALAQALVDPSRGLLPAAELRGDVLVSQALQALLAAAQASGGSSGPSGRTQEHGADGASLAAAATLLRAMQPSAKVLAALHTQLQAGGGGGGGTGSTVLAKLPAAAWQALQAFVSSHVPAAAGREEGEQATGGEAAEGSSAGAKRKRAAGGSKGASAAVQQQLLALLGGGGGGKSAATWRPPRPVATAATTTAGAPTGAGASSAAPSTSTRRSGQPASSSREPASSARPVRSRSVRRSVRSRVLQEEESDSEASS